MNKFFLRIIITLLTFGFGFCIYRISAPNLSIETITNYTSFYDGMDVTIETYAQLESYDENSWYIGEPFEKYEVWTNLDLENNSTNLETLHSQLRENLTKTNYKRAKVLVKGKVKDNCKTVSENGSISFGCCFGRSITLKAEKVTQLAPVENYQRLE